MSIRNYRVRISTTLFGSARRKGQSAKAIWMTDVRNR